MYDYVFEPILYRTELLLLVLFQSKENEYMTKREIDSPTHQSSAGSLSCVFIRDERERARESEQHDMDRL